MAEPGWHRHAVRIGRFEFRRTVRALRGDAARLGLMALGIVVPSLLLTGGVVLFADAIRSAGPVALPDAVRGTVALLWLFGAFVVAQRVATARPRVDCESLMLTTVSARTVAGGLALAETLRALAYLGPPILTLAALVGYLFGPSVALLAVPVAGVLLAMTVVVAGSLAGYAVAWLVATVPFVARHRTALGGVAALLFFGAYAAVQFPQTGLGGQELLAVLPFGWVVDVAVVGTPIEGSPPRAVAAVAASAVVVAAGGWLIERTAGAFWYVDPVSVGDGEERAAATGEASGGRGDALAAAIRPLAVPSAVDAPTRHVAEWVLLRTRRDPRRLTFLLFPVVFLGSALLNAGAAGGSFSLRAVAAPLCAVGVPWLAGALFAMNPLGDEGNVLPVTLMATTGRQYVRGLALPGLLAGLPTVVVVTAAAGAVSPYAPARAAGLVALGAYLTVVATAITPAVGMALPRFSAVRIGQSRAVLPPRIAAVAVHAALTVLPGATLALLVVAPDLARSLVAVVAGYLPAALVGLLAGGSGPLADAAAAFAGVGRAVATTDPTRFRVAAGGLLLVGGAAVSTACHRHAVARFDGYRPS